MRLLTDLVMEIHCLPAHGNIAKRQLTWNRPKEQLGRLIFVRRKWVDSAFVLQYMERKS